MLRSPYRMLGLLLLVVALTMLSGCATVPIAYDYDHDYTFRSVKYFAWLDAPPSEQSIIQRNNAVARQIVGKVNGRLLARGFEEVPVDSADFLLAFHVGSKSRITVSETGYYYMEWGSRFHDYQYHDGTLVLDVIDPESRRLVWRGWSTGIVQLDRQSLQDDVDRAIEKLIANFPPQ